MDGCWSADSPSLLDLSISVNVVGPDTSIRFDVIITELAFPVAVIERTIDTELVEELTFLDNYDRTKKLK